MADDNFPLRLGHILKLRNTTCLNLPCIHVIFPLVPEWSRLDEAGIVWLVTYMFVPTQPNRTQRMWRWIFLNNYSAMTFNLTYKLSLICNIDVLFSDHKHVNVTYLDSQAVTCWKLLYPINPTPQECRVNQRLLKKESSKKILHDSSSFNLPSRSLLGD